MKTRLLKCIPANRTTLKDFVWPKRGTVECPDWDPSPQCGRGLHAWRWVPSDDPHCVYYSQLDDCIWLVIEVLESDIVDLAGKCKFRRGRVVFSGSFADAVNRLKRPPDRAGFYGTAEAGDYSTAFAGEYGTAKAGRYGTAITSYGGTATVCDGGTAISGVQGISSAGLRGTAISGSRGVASAGERGVIILDFWDKASERLVRRVAAVGQDGIEAGKRYRLDDDGQFAEVKK